MRHVVSAVLAFGWKDGSRHAAIGLACLLTLMVGVAEAARTPLDQAEGFVTQFTSEAAQILQTQDMDDAEKRDRLRGMLAEGFALDQIGLFVLGRYRRGLTEAQIEAYQQRYFEFVLTTYYERLSGFARWTINVENTKAYGDEDALVESRVDRQGDQTLRVSWRISQVAEDLKIVDVIFEGVSLAVTQKSEFNAVLSRNGFDGLMDAMRKKIEETKG